MFLTLAVIWGSSFMWIRIGLDEGVAPGDILDKGLVAGMSVIGEKFKKNQVYVPDNSERWAADLAPAKDEIRRQVISKFKTQFKALVKQCLIELGHSSITESLAGKDEVDILDGGVTGEVASAG